MPSATAEAGIQVQLWEDAYEVVLKRHDGFDLPAAARCLQEVFGHEEMLADHLAAEAMDAGRTIAEVEQETDARRHLEDLTGRGYSAEIGRIGDDQEADD